MIEEMTPPSLRLFLICMLYNKFADPKTILKSNKSNYVLNILDKLWSQCSSPNSTKEEEEIIEESSYEGTRSFLKPYEKVKNTKVRLNNGMRMPVLGFGTHKLQGLGDVFQIMEYVLRVGYKLIDTASDYFNERDIGTSLAAHLPQKNLDRDDIFIVSKLATMDQCHGKVRRAVMKSLKNLMMDDIDLYLIHFPGANVSIVPKDDSQEHQTLRHETWEELVRLLEEEKLKAIGVSNFCSRHLIDLLEFSSVKPVVNQVEFHPHYHQPKELLDLCAENNIFLQAYGLFGGGEPAILYDPVILQVMEKMRKRIHYLSSSQLILRWALQSGYGVLTKATDYTPIYCNAQLDFKISQRHMKMINSIEKRTKYYWDPEYIVH